MALREYFVGWCFLPAIACAGYYDVTYLGGELDVVGPLGGTWVAPYTQGGNTYAAGAQSTEEGEPGLTGPGSVTHEGEITIEFMWVPEHPGDNPPNVVVIKEMAAVTWIGQSGFASNALGDPQLGNSTTKTSSGVKYTKREWPGDYFTISWSPTGSASLTSTYQGPPALACASLSSEHSVEIITPEIHILGLLGNECLVGQEIQLTAVAPGLMVEVLQWSIPNVSASIIDEILTPAPGHTLPTTKIQSREVIRMQAWVADNPLRVAWDREWPGEDELDCTFRLVVPGEINTVVFVTSEPLRVREIDDMVFEFIGGTMTGNLVNVYSPGPATANAATIGASQTPLQNDSWHVLGAVRIPDAFRAMQGEGEMAFIQFAEVWRKKTWWFGWFDTWNESGLDNDYPYEGAEWVPTVVELYGENGLPNGNLELSDQPSTGLRTDAQGHTHVEIDDYYEPVLLFKPPLRPNTTLRSYPILMARHSIDWTFYGTRSQFSPWGPAQGGVQSGETTFPLYGSPEWYEIVLNQGE